MKIEINADEKLAVLILDGQQDFERMQHILNRGMNCMEVRGKDLEAAFDQLSAATKRMKEQTCPAPTST